MTRKIIVLLTIAGLVSMTGCSKQLANLSLKKANKRLEEARKNEADKYSADLLKSSEDSIAAAQSSLNQQAYKDAQATAKQAADLAAQTLESAKQKRASVKLNEANQAVEIADRNDGVRQDAERYQKIKDIQAKVQTKYQDNKWDATIELSDQLQEEVTVLLNPLRNQADSGKIQVQNALKEMSTADAPNYAPEYVIEVTDLLSDIDELINTRRDYKSAVSQANAALQRAQEGIVKAKEKRSSEKISKLEEDLSLAVRLGGEIYAADLMHSCQDQFNDLLTRFYEGSYDAVLQGVGLLEPKVVALIYQTRKESARAKIQTVEKAIASLVDGGVRAYLEGRVEKIEPMLADMKQKFDQEMFEDVEAIAAQALTEDERIKEDFNTLALEYLRNAGNDLDVADKVFTRMADIFDVRSPELQTKIEADFENAKKAFQVELRGVLDNTRLTLEVARIGQEEARWQKSIELAKEVQKTAHYVLDETYHVVAHNAILELTNQIAIYERDGARQYAAEELDKTKNLLESAKELLSAGQHADAVRKSAEVKAQLGVTIAELRKQAVTSIAGLQQGVDQAVEARVPEFQPDALRNAQQMLSDAENALKGERLSGAIETATQGRGMISGATADAYRLWAQEEMARAERRLEEAQQAGADEVAAAELKDAHGMLEDAKRYFVASDFKEAQKSAAQSAETAQAALYKRVTLAEEAIASARSYDAWQVDYVLLAKAIVDAKTAREDMDQSNYSESTFYANRARESALAVTKETKKANFNRRLNEIRDTVNLAIASGASYFQVEETKGVLAQTAKADQEFDVGHYEEMMARLDAVDAQLAKTMAETPEVLGKVTAIQRKKLDDLKFKGASETDPDMVDQANLFMKYADYDFEARKYGSSYRNLRKAMDTIADLEGRFVEQEYIDSVSQLFTELNDSFGKFRNIIELQPTVLNVLSQGPNGRAQAVSVAGGYTPNRFRTAIDDLNAEARALSVPPGRESLNRQVLGVFRTAQLAAMNFEKLEILDQYSRRDVKKFIDEGARLIALTRDKEEEVRKTFGFRERPEPVIQFEKRLAY